MADYYGQSSDAGTGIYGFGMSKDSYGVGGEDSANTTSYGGGYGGGYESTYDYGSQGQGNGHDVGGNSSWKGYSGADSGGYDDYTDRSYSDSSHLPIPKPWGRGRGRGASSGGLDQGRPPYTPGFRGGRGRGQASPRGGRGFAPYGGGSGRGAPFGGRGRGDTGRGRGGRGRGDVRGRGRGRGNSSYGPVVKVDPIQFYCKVCEVECQSQGPYDMHVGGQKHQRNVKAKANGEPITKYAAPRLKADVDATEEPLVGLEYVTEYRKEDASIEATYCCNLCEIRCDPRTILKHAQGYKHRTNYMQVHYVNYYVLVKQNGTKNSERSALTDEYCRIIEKETKRKSMKVKVQSGTGPYEVKFEAVKRPDREDSTEETDGVPKSGRRKRPADEKLTEEMYAQFSKRLRTELGMEGQDLETTRLVSGGSALKNFLGNLSTCLITNEEEANMALQVSNHLTQAMLKYKSTPPLEHDEEGGEEYEAEENGSQDEMA